MDRHATDEAVRQQDAAWLDAVLSSTEDALIATDLDGVVLRWNQGAQRLYGYAAGEIIGQPSAILAPADRRDEWALLIGQAAEGASIKRLETVRLHKDGHLVDVLLTVAPIVDGGQRVGLSVIARDITVLLAAVNAQRRARQDIEAQEHILRQIARGEDLVRTLEDLCREVEVRYPEAHCSILVADPTERVLHHAAAPSLPVEFQDAIDGLPIAVGMGACGTAASTGDDVVVVDVQADPVTAPFRELAATHDLGAVWSHPLVNRAGEVLGTFAVYRSLPHEPSANERRIVTAAGRLATLAIERQRDEAALTAASLVDALTGLPNRAQFLSLLERALQAAPASTAVLFLDLDRFKAINDSMGHPAGDLLLVEAARRLGRALRADDVLSRFGGDEFTVLVRDADTWGLAAVADRILDTFTEPFVVDGREFYMTVSIGIAVGSTTSGPFDLIRDADVAMYEAKAQGAGRCVVFGEQLRHRALERVSLEAELRHALDHHELVVHYQPIFDLETARCVGAEALVRWAHPERGLLAPDRFIPLAEETGLIDRVGAAVLDEVLAQLGRWEAAGLDLSVSVNVSAMQLSDPTFVEVVEAAVAREQVGLGRLRLEITETALMEQLDAARGYLARMARAGVAVFIDDFGTGYSSISRLSDLPVVGVKIDRRFTAALGEDPSMTKITTAIVDLAAALELQVIAEGVETQDALDALTDIGCAYGQGFFLGRPDGPEAITALFG